jgi:hypothetical protein
VPARTAVTQDEHGQLAVTLVGRGHADVLAGPGLVALQRREGGERVGDVDLPLRCARLNACGSDGGAAIEGDLTADVVGAAKPVLCPLLTALAVLQVAWQAVRT